MGNPVQVNNAAAPGIVIANPQEFRSFKNGAGFVSRLNYIVTNRLQSLINMVCVYYILQLLLNNELSLYSISAA